MLSRIEVLGYKCLRWVGCDLQRFHVLVGPNSSGKSTFLDVPLFLRDLVRDGPAEAVRSRAPAIRDLLWQNEGHRMEFAVEARIPEDRRESLERPDFDTCRYEVAVGSPSAASEIVILGETLLLKKRRASPPQLLLEFPRAPNPPQSLFTPKRGHDTRMVVTKVPEGNDNFYAETRKGWYPAFKLGPRRSALGNLPEDETKFPVATWFKELLNGSVVTFALRAEALRKPSPPHVPGVYQMDGSSLPWIIHDMRKTWMKGFGPWLEHVRTALPDIEDVDTFLRPEDQHRYLLVRYASGVTVPSWGISDGTLRMLALTLLAYLPKQSTMFLIEEPENGIHPRAVEAVFESLSSVYDGQVFVATHSPIILKRARPNDVLCFARDNEGASDIVGGSQHPALRDWQGDPNLSVLFAAGVLG